MKKGKFSTKSKAAKKGKLSAQQQKIFGVPLEGISLYDPQQGWVLPALVQRSILKIQQDTKQEGIFRLSAQASLVNEIRASYDSGNDVDLSDVESNVCCGLLKLFLREMPEPLFPFNLYKAFVGFEEENFKRDKEYLKILLQNLAGPRKPLFFQLFRLLHEISKESEHNLMDASNLAVVLGPTVLRCESSDLKTQLADATSVNEATACFISHFDELEEPCTESFLAVAEATSSYTDDASGLTWKSGDVFFLRKELDDNAWQASFRGEDGQIPAEKFKMLMFLDLGKGVQSPGLDEAQEEVQEEEDPDSQAIDSLIGFCAQSCMVMQQMQEENEQLRAAVKSLQNLTKALIPLVPEASKVISSKEVDRLARPLHCTSKSGIAFLNEQLQCIIAAREKSYEDSGKEPGNTPLTSRMSMVKSESLPSAIDEPSPSRNEARPPFPKLPANLKSDISDPKKKRRKKSTDAPEPRTPPKKMLSGISIDMAEVRTRSITNPAPMAEPETKRVTPTSAATRRAKMQQASHFNQRPEDEKKEEEKKGGEEKGEKEGEKKEDTGQTEKEE